MRLTSKTFNDAVATLAGRDADLGAIIDRFGPPKMWRRTGSYATLVLLILEQQVSLSSAQTACRRLTAAAGTLTPEHVGQLSDREFRAAGVSRQKTRYIRHLGDSVLDRSLRIDLLGRKADDDVRDELMRIKGVGPWTADVYLLTCLMRPDVWPVGDIALQAAAQEVKGLEARPGPAELAGIGEAWRPWRSVAARILWQHYLNTVRARKGNAQ